MKKLQVRKERWAVTVNSVVVVSIIIVKAKGAIVIVRQAMILDIVVIANVIVIVATGIEGNS